MGKAPFGRVCDILGIYDTPAPATSELAGAQSALARVGINVPTALYGSGLRTISTTSTGESSEYSCTRTVLISIRVAWVH